MSGASLSLRPTKRAKSKEQKPLFSSPPPNPRSRGRGVTLWPVSPSLVRPRPLARALGVMNTKLPVPHADCIDIASIQADFSKDRLHRYSLTLPFLGRTTGRKLLVVGQNPSEATEVIADKTIRYLELFVFQNLTQYDGIEMLNLYTRMDTKKKKTDVLDELSDEKFEAAVTPNSDVLLVFGRLKNQQAYKFKNRATQLRKHLERANLYKLAIGTNYAPHPGNPRILYSNFKVVCDAYLFNDL